ncbi:MAG: glycosyltransferase family 2 protein [Mucinivorans sp.]
MYDKTHAMPPKVSIITVVRNAAQALNSTLEALVAMDYPNKEIILIDGLSTDLTPEVIKRYAQHISYWVSEKDSGLYDAMNKGIQAATGDYLWFINAGDKPYSPHTLSLIFAAGEPLHDIYFGGALIVDAQGAPLGLRRKALPRELSWRSLQWGMVVCHQSFLVSRAIAPRYDLHYRYASDIDWVIRCLKASTSTHNTHLILSQFAQGGLSSAHRAESWRERYAIMRHHYGPARTTLLHLWFVLRAALERGRDYRALPKDQL